MGRMRKVVINACFGGFGLSERAVLRYLELAKKKAWPERGTSKLDKALERLGGLPRFWLVPPGPERVDLEPQGEKWNEMTMKERNRSNRKHDEQVFSPRELGRDDPILVKVVEELGDDANGQYAELKIVEIPHNVKWHIEEYDGNEHVAEDHGTWQ